MLFKEINMKTILIILGIAVALVFFTQIYFMTAKTETQPYEVVKNENEFEIRLYPPATMASVSMKASTYKELSSSGFKKLASYIFGGNQANKSIAMTTPVHMDINDTISFMSFVMPAEFQKDNLPLPNDSTISIKTSTEEYAAAIQFSGYAGDESIKKYATKLENTLKENGIKYYGNFRFLGYNAPYQFLGRKNEVIVSIQWKDK
jgi:hypothetical protein